MKRELDDLMPGKQIDPGSSAGCFCQNLLQIGPVDRQIGVPVPTMKAFAQWHRYDPAATPTANLESLGLRSPRNYLVLEPQTREDAERVWGDLDSSANLCEIVGAFGDLNIEPNPGAGECSREATDSTARDQCRQGSR